MSKRTLVLWCLGAVVLAAMYVTFSPREITIVAKAVKEGPSRDIYEVTVRRWEDHRRGGRYKRHSDRFAIELSHRGGMPISAYEFETAVPVTNVVITWPELEQFAVAFDTSLTLRCTLNEGKPVWESK